VGPALKALIPIVTTAEFRSVTYPGESFALDTILLWAQSMQFQEIPPLRLLLARLKLIQQLKRAFKHLPLNQADTVAANKTINFYQDWLEHDAPCDHYWEQSDHTARLAQVSAPVHLIGGWYDVLFPQTLACYHSLKEAGRNPYFTIGPWTHGAAGLQPVMMKETLAWCRAHLLNDRSGMRVQPVRLYVMGLEEWRDFDAWPPAGYNFQRWHLHAEATLSPSQPKDSTPDRYRYDPVDPTPSVGGSSLSPNSGRRDNRKLEARQDVLVYTSAPLESDLEAIGLLQVELYIKSSLGHTDFFARLCNVSPSGKSTNLGDGIQRLVPGHPLQAADGVIKVQIELWPTAHCFKKGHRIRLLISSGAHPRFARNSGNAEPLANATKLIAADQQIFHDSGHPSAVILPVKDLSQ
jgi:putative CocE/NonD family hydrolase